ncbi:MAG: DUF4914 family protein, partial [Pirellulales bacterium]|nr:DUF4914 family protein [Pirellulales bacterium]
MLAMRIRRAARAARIAARPVRKSQGMRYEEELRTKPNPARRGFTSSRRPSGHVGKAIRGHGDSGRGEAAPGRVLGLLRPARPRDALPPGHGARAAGRRLRGGLRRARPGSRGRGLGDPLPQRPVDHPVPVDIRGFGLRTPPTTRETPGYGILGLFHVLPPALAWLWRLVAPRGYDNSSITESQGMSSEGVGSFWPFATGRRGDPLRVLPARAAAVSRKGPGPDGPQHKPTYAPVCPFGRNNRRTASSNASTPAST